MVNTVLDHTGAPTYCWLLCLMYVSFILNNCFSKNIGSTPLQQCTGTTNDINPVLCFDFYEPVYFLMDDSAFPSESKEHHSLWVGVSENVGNFMTFKVLTYDTLKIIHRSNICSAHDPTAKNLCLDLLIEDFPEIIKLIRQQSGQDVYSPASDHGEMEAHMQNSYERNNSPINVSNTSTPSMAVVDPQDLVGWTFLMVEHNDGQHFQAKIVECIYDHESAKTQTSNHVKFWCSVNDDAYEDLISYNEMMDYIQKNTENEQKLWRFKHIIGHQGPLKPSDHHYLGSCYNVQVEWENGEISYEPLGVIAKDNFLSCAIYARDNDLLEVPGWKQFRCLTQC